MMMAIKSTKKLTLRNLVNDSLTMVDTAQVMFQADGDILATTGAI
jgi:hypothetical protein